MEAAAGLVCPGGTHGPDELPCSDADLHLDLLWRWVIRQLPSRAGRADRNRHLRGADGLQLVVALAISLRAHGMAVAVAHLRSDAANANRRFRARSDTGWRTLRESCYRRLGPHR